MAGSQRLGCDTIHSMVLYVTTYTALVMEGDHGVHSTQSSWPENVVHTLACAWLQGFKVAKVVYGKSTYTQLLFLCPLFTLDRGCFMDLAGIHCLVVMASNTIPLSGKGLQLESV